MLSRLTLLGFAATLAGGAATSPARAGDDIPVSRSSAASPQRTLFHKAKGHTCEKCAAAKAAAMANAGPMPGSIPDRPGGMAEGSQIVGCSHSANGVCASCRKLLEMPGEVTMVTPGDSVAPAAPSVAVASMPGRATASDVAPGRAVVASGDPEPIGVMKTNYAPSVPAGPSAMKRAGVQGATPAAPAAHAPFMPPAKEGNPHILGHLFGFSAMGRDMRDLREMKGRRQRETHAATAYGPSDGRVEELPASMVYGKRDH